MRPDALQPLSSFGFLAWVQVAISVVVLMLVPRAYPRWGARLLAVLVVLATTGFAVADRLGALPAGLDPGLRDVLGMAAFFIWIAPLLVIVFRAFDRNAR